MREQKQPWVVVAEYDTVLMAEFAVETLREAGIPAQVDGGAHVALFGAGYQGGSLFGVKVRVPWHREHDARHLLDAVEDEDPPETPAPDPAP